MISIMTKYLSNFNINTLLHLFLNLTYKFLNLTINISKINCYKQRLIKKIRDLHYHYLLTSITC